MRRLLAVLFHRLRCVR